MISDSNRQDECRILSEKDKKSTQIPGEWGGGSNIRPPGFLTRPDAIYVNYVYKHYL